MKILIIEDEAQLSKSILSYLKDEKYSCDLAENFASAQGKLESFDYDCITAAVMGAINIGPMIWNFKQKKYFLPSYWL